MIRTELRLDEGDPREDAVWKQSYVDDLADNAFLHVEEGGKKDGDGKTVPRTLRHFPFKDDSGKVDVLHLRNAISQAPKSSLPEKVRGKIEDRARKLLANEEGGNRADEVRFDASRLQRTPQGGLRIPAAVSRVGVFPYRQPDGTIRNEYRPAEQVFHKDSLASLESAPITIGHLAEVTTENYAALSKGHVREPRQDGDHVAAETVVQDAVAVGKIERRELVSISPGYTTMYVPSPGVFRGARYDGIQTNIRYNHIALLAPGRGRQGDTVALRLDVCQDNEDTMTIRFDGKDYDVSDAAQKAAYEKAVGDHALAAAAGEVTASKKRADEAEAARDTAVAKLAPHEAAAKAAGRTKLEDRARKILGEAGKEVKFDSKLTDRQVQEQILTARKIDFAGRTDEYVSARFDGLEDSVPATETPAATTDPVLLAASGTGPQVKSVNEVSGTPMTWGNAWQSKLASHKDK